MRKILVTLLSTVAMMGIASLAFAADGAPLSASPSSAAPSAWPSPPPVAVSVRASV